MWHKASQLPSKPGRYWTFTPADFKAYERPASLCVLYYDMDLGWLSPYQAAPLAQQWLNWMSHWTEFPPVLKPGAG